MLNSFAGASWIFLKLHPDKIQIQFESVDSRGILDKFALCLSVGEWQNWEFLQRKKKPRFEVFYRGHSNIWWDIMEDSGRVDVWVPEKKQTVGINLFFIWMLTCKKAISTHSRNLSLGIFLGQPWLAPQIRFQVFSSAFFVFFRWRNFAFVWWMWNKLQLLCEIHATSLQNHS